MNPELPDWVKPGATFQWLGSQWYVRALVDGGVLSRKWRWSKKEWDYEWHGPWIFDLARQIMADPPYRGTALLPPEPPEPGDGFTFEDFGDLQSQLLTAHDDDVSAILSNNFNVVLAALNRIQPVTLWHPPETAPKDDKPFLITNGSRELSICEWAEERERFEDYFFNSQVKPRWPSMIAWKPLPAPAEAGEDEASSRAANGFRAIGSQERGA